MIKVEVHSTRAVIRSQEPLTVGLRGVKARFVFGAGWESLIKTGVFRQGDKTVTVADIGEEVIIPWEVLTLPGVPVQIGVYGSNADGTVAIPTLWTNTAPVRPGADPEGDPSTEPTPGLWEQLQGKMGSLEQLDTNEKTSLVAAINEANRPVFVVTVCDAGDGTDTSDYDVETIRTKMDAGVPVVCYWYEKEIVLPLAGFQIRHMVIFAAVCDAVEYRVIISENGVHCYTAELMERTPIPTKTSDLENDSGYLTEAPVTSVNGQKGDVILPTPVYLVTLNSSDRTEQPYADIIAAYQAGYDVRCSYKGYLLPLKLEPVDECVFSGTVDTTSYSVVVYSNGTVSAFDRSLAQKKEIPSKTSDLENDSGYLTSAPVTSVNGQTGDVTVSPLLVTVTDNGEGTYVPDRSYSELRVAHGEGRTLLCWYAEDGVYLPLTADQGAFVFSAVVNSFLYEISIYMMGGDRPQFAVVSKTELSALNAGTVKTVNGLGPDENGNVEIDAGGEGLTNTEKSLLLSLFENAAYVNGDMGVVFRQLRNLWQGAPEDALLYWDHTLGESILNCGFTWVQSGAADATYSMTDEGFLMTNPSIKAMPFIKSADELDYTKIEVEYVVHPVELLDASSNWGGICICSTPLSSFTALSPHHAVAMGGNVAGSYVLSELNRDYTITISGGKVYVDREFVVDTNQSAGTLAQTALGCNGTMYIKSICIRALEA